MTADPMDSSFRFSGNQAKSSAIEIVTASP
jgi:hypothetical protein